MHRHKNDKKGTHVIIRDLLRFTPFIAFGIAACIVQEAHAAGIQATVTTRVASDTGVNGGGFALFLNGSPLPIVEEQTVSLGPGDVLRAEVSADATTDVNQPSSIRRDVIIDFSLDAGTDSAMVRRILSGTVDSTGTIGTLTTGAVDNEDLCAFAFGCAVPGSPGFFAGLNAVISETLPSTGGNRLIINNQETPTGRVGGIETIDLEFLFDLQRREGLLEDPSARTFVGAVGFTAAQGFASGSGTLELRIVPVPAAAWLFGSALGLLGWVRARQGH